MSKVKERDFSVNDDVFSGKWFDIFDYQNRMHPMTKRFMISLLVVLTASASLTGCAKIPYKSAAQKPVTSYAAPEGYKFLQHVSDEKYQFHLFWGLVAFDADGQDGVFSKYINNGDAIVNVTSNQKWDIISWLASSFTYGIVHLTHTEFNGDLVQKA